MKKILLVDADSVIPNIPLMKLSSWHKANGDKVEFMKCNIPYYPNRKKKIVKLPKGFDITYCSVVFDGNKEYVIGNNIIFGGTGVDLTTVLPKEVECCIPDYSIYPDNDTAYGFITRGCIRNCSFCKVPAKEGMIHRVSSINSILQSGHKRVKFLDNNILAYPKHKQILQYLIDRRILCQFCQGLDIRLLDSENSELLYKLRYIGEYIFAFDSWKYRKIIDKKLELLNWRKPWQLKFFVYVNSNMELSETVNRIIWLKRRSCLPYIMRDINCWNNDKILVDFYTDLAAYCNQVSIFKSMEFNEFLKRRHVDANRIKFSSSLWGRANVGLVPGY